MSNSPLKILLLDLLRQAHLGQDTFLQSLNPTERNAPGTPEHWSAKDHIAHITFWQQRLVLKLAAVLCGETPSVSEDFEQLNSQILEKRRLHPWPDILVDAEEAYAAIISHIQQLSEEDLAAQERFHWIPDHEPLYMVIVGPAYEHVQQHFAQYYLDRHDFSRAVQMYESWNARVVQSDAPDIMKGHFLYNLACFYATHAQLEKASIILEQALTLYPRLKEFSLTDPDLIALRPAQAE